MGDYTQQQRDDIYEFKNCTDSDELLTVRYLELHNWDLQAAFNQFWGDDKLPKLEDVPHYMDIYKRYKDPNVDMVLVDGITLLCNDLEVDPQDIVMLVLSFYMGAATMCEFTKDEFLMGLDRLKVDSLEKFKEKVPFMRSELKDSESFQKIYNFAYNWAKEKEQKTLPLDTAIEMWQMLFAIHPWPLLDHWFRFLQEQYNNQVSQDVWNQLLEFARTVDPSLSDYDPDGAWPCLIDDFVDHMTETGLVQKRLLRN